MNGTYDSCKNVAIPSTGGIITDTMCLPYSSATCNAER